MVRKYVGMTCVSPVHACRDIEDPLKKGLIAQGDAAGRSTYYDLAIPGWAWSRAGNVAHRSLDEQRLPRALAAAGGARAALIPIATYMNLSRISA
jgi:hypothetical protein